MRKLGFSCSLNEGNTEGVLLRFDDKVFYLIRSDGVRSKLSDWDWSDDRQEEIRFTRDGLYGRMIIRVLTEDSLELTEFHPDAGFVDWKLQRR